LALLVLGGFMLYKTLFRTWPLSHRVEIAKEKVIVEVVEKSCKPEEQTAASTWGAESSALRYAPVPVVEAYAVRSNQLQVAGGAIGHLI
jgi:hypothetical protein